MVNKQRLIQTFLDLVQIDSPSEDEALIVQEAIKRLQILGAIVEKDTYGNVIAKLQASGEPFLINAHLDTVEPGRNIKPIVGKDAIHTDNTTILGADPKAGVAAILEGLTSIKEDSIHHKNLEIVFTLGEEVGLLGARNLDYTKISAKQGVTFDGEEAVTNVDVEAPGMIIVDATITGKAAHAGVEPEKGISSIQIASKIISKLPLGRIDEETTTNIGVITGGSVRNAVPELTQIKGEIRSRDKRKLESMKAKWQEIFKTIMKEYPSASLEMIMEKDGEAYKLHTTSPIVKQTIQALKTIGLKPNFIKSGGLTDVNVFALHGIDAVVVGAGAHHMHTKQETVVISEMLQAAQFAEAICKA